MPAKYPGAPFRSAKEGAAYLGCAENVPRSRRFRGIARRDPNCDPAFRAPANRRGRIPAPPASAPGHRLPVVRWSASRVRRVPADRWTGATHKPAAAILAYGDREDPGIRIGADLRRWPGPRSTFGYSRRELRVTRTNPCRFREPAPCGRPCPARTGKARGYGRPGLCCIPG